ncbi:4-hydroxy-3-methylbut-2-enyl diphosphate reductase [Kitasatospora sp. SolWspMP-SS2h]|uniref:hypothetical protein n=1 Tax=Kitasatospora sp. SolWspMP-SS2h TaxID=1305729 RepID=UPI000DC03AFC|nr:hypothetical protein [Kitasatospora sp. SolWspMP-SS2h]RAJ31778.1 4-hydroxy-3-methylbut-2-enyl diphosphate reductase [Kitasatospora sp. SolWspMP-SS2h]
MVGRSSVTEEFTAPELGGDAVVVPSVFHHPVRGVVHCPAAPLLTAWLQRHDTKTAVTALHHQLTPRDPDDGGQAVVATTFLDTTGQVFGLAVAADAERLPQARAAVATWSAVLRTRRMLLPAGAEPCAVPAAPASRLPHPRTTVVPPAPDCPHADAALQCLRRFAERGETVLLVGAGPLMPFAPCPRGNRVVAVPSIEAARAVRVADPAALSFVLRPCTLIEDAAAILAVLRARFPMLRGQHPDQWCYRAEDRRAAVNGAAACSDVALVLPGRDGQWSAPARRTVRLTSLADLYPGHLRNASTVAVIGGDSDGLTPDTLTRVLTGLGPVSVVEHHVNSRVLPRTATRSAPPA